MGRLERLLGAEQPVKPAELGERPSHLGL